MFADYTQCVLKTKVQHFVLKNVLIKPLGRGWRATSSLKGSRLLVGDPCLKLRHLTNLVSYCWYSNMNLLPLYNCHF